MNVVVVVFVVIGVCWLAELIWYLRSKRQQRIEQAELEAWLKRVEQAKRRKEAS